MRGWILTIAIMGYSFWAAAQRAGFQLEGIGSVLVPVTGNKMTNLIFPERVQTGVKVSRDVLVQKVKGVENVIEIKAVRRGFVPTNLSVYGRDGRLYSFTLRYVEDTAVLNYRVVAPDLSAPVLLTGLPASETRLRTDAERFIRLPPFLHVSTRDESLRLRLAGVYLRDSLEWLVFTLSNGSSIPFRPEHLRTYLLDSKQVRRRAEQEVAEEPVYTGPWLTLDYTTRIAVGFEPFTVSKGKRLVVEFTGKDGRMLELRVKGRVLLKTRVE